MHAAHLVYVEYTEFIYTCEWESN